jgi:hypothetical protein
MPDDQPQLAAFVAATAGDLIHEALSEHEFNARHNMHPRKSDAVGNLIGKGDKALKALELDVQSRLNSQVLDA